MRFLLLGSTVPSIAGADLVTDTGAQYAAIILTKRAEPAELLDTLAQTPDPALPIADFVGSNPLRRDFAAAKLDAESVAEMKREFGPIWRRLEALPFRAAREDRDPLTLLRLIYSRNKPAKAAFVPDSPAIVQYPLLGMALGTRRELESLAVTGLLNRRHFARTHACEKCGSGRLNVYEACPACNSGDLIEEVLVHHYRCGCQEPESHFAQGLLLICPKCRRELRHLGLDYGKPGKVLLCRSCGAENSEPLIHFVCLDCSAVTPPERAPETDWYDYDLTDRGMEALHLGRLPRIELKSQLEQGTRIYSLSEFHLLAAQELQVARQHHRPFSVMRISMAHRDARGKIGAVAADAAFRLAVEKIAALVQRGDVVGLGRDNTVFIAFPERPAAELGGVEQRFRQAVEDGASPLKPVFDYAEGDDAVALFAER